MSKMRPGDTIPCPLCGEGECGGFDRIGLLGHIRNGWCSAIEEIEEEERAERESRWKGTKSNG